MSVYRIIINRRSWKQGVPEKEVQTEVNRALTTFGLPAEKEKQICPCGKDAEILLRGVAVCWNCSTVKTATENEKAWDEDRGYDL